MAVHDSSPSCASFPRLICFGRKATEAGASRGTASRGRHVTRRERRQCAMCGRQQGRQGKADLSALAQLQRFPSHGLDDHGLDGGGGGVKRQRPRVTHTNAWLQTQPATSVHNTVGCYYKETERSANLEGRENTNEYCQSLFEPIGKPAQPSTAHTGRHHTPHTTHHAPHTTTCTTGAGTGTREIVWCVVARPASGSCLAPQPLCCVFNFLLELH